jgi:ATP-binding cassette subfamily C exporter for protease/lipase
LVVLDEPDASLDQDGRRGLIDMMYDLRERGVIVVLISHRTNLLKHTDKVMVLDRGRAEITPSQLSLERSGLANTDLIEKHSANE